jgi:hypothetical protein
VTITKKAVMNRSTHTEVLLFSAVECQYIIDWAIRYGKAGSGLIHTSPQASGSDLRRCKEYSVDAGQISFNDGSTALQRVSSTFADGNVWNLSYLDIPSVRVMEYQVGDGYGRHTDWSPGAAKERKLSMTVQLSSHYAYKGGRVVLYAGPEDDHISQVQGMATVWPSWTLHEVLPVEQGVRYSLTAWAHGEEFR